MNTAYFVTIIDDTTVISSLSTSASTTLTLLRQFAHGGASVRCTTVTTDADGRQNYQDWADKEAFYDALIKEEEK